MDDKKIIDMFWSRNERAVEEMEEKYGKFCFSIAFNILSDRQDADEVVNDTYMNAWRSIPPHRPDSLKAFLGKITRCAALKKWRDAHTEKRGGGQITLICNELSECVAYDRDIDENLQAEELAKVIDRFIGGLPEAERRIFVLRYWYLFDVEWICRQYGFTRSKVRSMTYRTRKKLRAYLEKEGIYFEK